MKVTVTPSVLRALKAIDPDIKWEEQSLTRAGDEFVVDLSNKVLTTILSSEGIAISNRVTDYDESVKDTLIDVNTLAEKCESVSWIPTHTLVRSVSAIRREPSDLDLLVKSMRKDGWIQTSTITVNTVDGADFYEVVDGSRRVMAAWWCEIDNVLANVYRDLTLKEIIGLQLIKNR